MISDKKKMTCLILSFKKLRHKEEKGLGLYFELSIYLCHLVLSSQAVEQTVVGKSKSFLVSHLHFFF